MVTILMMSAKLATPGLLKIKIFRNKGYGIIISDYDVTNKILLHDSNHIIDVVIYNPTFVESQGKKWQGDLFVLPILNRVKNSFFKKYLRMTAFENNLTTRKLEQQPPNVFYKKSCS